MADVMVDTMAIEVNAMSGMHREREAKAKSIGIEVSFYFWCFLLFPFARFDDQSKFQQNTPLLLDTSAPNLVL